LAGNGEGVWLIDECKEHLVTKGLSWASSIAVEVQPYGDVLRAWDDMLERVKALHGDVSRDKVLVTISGRLETRASLEDEVVHMPYGFRRSGFGHMGDSVAQIDVLSVGDVSVERGAAIKSVQ
jgi:hypothetical protein